MFFWNFKQAFQVSDLLDLLKFLVGATVSWSVDAIKILVSWGNLFWWLSRWNWNLYRHVSSVDVINIILFILPVWNAIVITLAISSLFIVASIAVLLVHLMSCTFRSGRTGDAPALEVISEEAHIVGTLGVPRKIRRRLMRRSRIRYHLYFPGLSPLHC